jgi:hypothetical protein
MALIISHANQIHVIATAAFLIHFIHADTPLSPSHADKTWNPQYNKYISTTKAKIHSIQFTAILINAKKYHNSVS